MERLLGVGADLASPDFTIDAGTFGEFAQVFHEITGLSDQDDLLLAPVILHGPSKEKEE